MPRIRITALTAIVAFLAVASVAALSMGVSQIVRAGPGAAPASAPATVPGVMSYQGYLTDPLTGDPVSDGTRNMRFKILDAATEGAVLWQEPADVDPAAEVEVADGLFTVLLGSAVPLDSSIFVGGNAYLQVEINGETLLPRQHLGAAPYAFVATEAAQLSDVTASAAELNKTDGIDANAFLVVAEEVTFTETAGAGTYTGSVDVPAGATILDVQVRSTALWDTATSATMDVGDTADPDGFYAAADLKATDLLVGEALTFEHPADKAGAYITGEQRDFYRSGATTVSGVVTTVGATGTAGRTRMLVVYAVPTSTESSKVDTP
jgi:hypothetical protein